MAGDLAGGCGVRGGAGGERGTRGGDGRGGDLGAGALDQRPGADASAPVDGARPFELPGNVALSRAPLLAMIAVAARRFPPDLTQARAGRSGTTAAGAFVA